jgi:Flp pilus assembly pilin Flp
MAGVVCVAALPSRSQVRGVRSVGRRSLQESDQMGIGGLSRGQAGQGLAEYALILALIAIVAVSALLFLGGSIDTILSTVDGTI